METRKPDRAGWEQNMDQIAVAAFEKDLKFEGFLLVRTS